MLRLAVIVSGGTEIKNTPKTQERIRPERLLPKLSRMEPSLKVHVKYAAALRMLKDTMRITISP